MKTLNALVVIVPLASFLFPTDAHALSFRICTDEETIEKLDRVKTKTAYNLHSSIEIATSVAPLAGLTPFIFGRFASFENEDASLPYFSIGTLASLAYLSFPEPDSGPICKPKREASLEPVAEPARIRAMHDRAKRQFWITYTLNSVTLLGYATKSQFKDRRTTAMIGLIAPLAIAFLKEWNPLIDAGDMTIEPQLSMLPDQKFATGLSVSLKF